MITLFLFITHASAQQRPQWGNLKEGPFNIGFRNMIVEDQSRSYGAGARTIQVYLFYPAKNVQRASMSFGDYFAASRFDWGADSVNTRLIGSLIEKAFRSGALNPSFPKPLSDSEFKKILRTPVPSYLNAQAASGKFPVLLHVHANGALHQSIMLEYLASYGYVVASISMYGSAPVHYGRGEEGAIGQHVMTDDLAFVFSKVKQLPFVDAQRVAVIGMMGQAGISLLMKENLGCAVACLDCYPDPMLMRMLPYYDLRKVKAPVMQLLNSSFWSMNRFVTDSLTQSPKTFIKINGLQHSDFYPFPKIAKPDSSSLFVNYEKVVRATHWFLDEVLYGKKKSLNDTTIRVTQLPGAQLVPTESSFLGWLRYNEMDSARKYFNMYGSLMAGQQNFFGTVLFMARDGDSNAREAYEMFLKAYPDDKRSDMIKKFLKAKE